MPWTNLPANGVLTYNGFSFDPLYRSKVLGRMIYDEAQRTVIATEYSFEVAATITANTGSSTNTTLATMRQALEAPGGEFHYDNKGLGTTFTVNASGGAVRDVNFGPKPQVLEFIPIGDGGAALVTWRCVVTVPETCNNPAYQFRLMAVNYEVGYEIDPDGLTTIRVTGYLEIPMTRNSANDRTLNDCADLYYERVAPLMPPGFRPGPRSRTVSKDKRRLDYSFEFIQNPNYALPADCTYASGSQSCRSMGTFFNWVNRISATYKVATNKPKQSAWNAFSALLLDRMAKTRLNSDVQGNSVLFVGMSIEDGLYLKSQEVSISFEYSFCASLQAVIQSAGVWTPVPGTNDAQWRSSVQAVLAPRGLAGFKLTPNNDAIIDLCAPLTSTFKPKPPPPPPPPGPEEHFFVACPAPQASWLAYKCDVEVEMEPEIARHKPLVTTLSAMPILGDANVNFPVKNPKSNKTGNGLGYAPPPAGGTFTSTSPQQAKIESVQGAQDKGFATLENVIAPADTFQLRTTPTFKIHLVGHALRACWPIDLPTLTSFGGWLAIPGKQTFKQGIFTSMAVPIRYMKWDLEFTVAGVPVGPVVTGRFKTSHAWALQNQPG